MRIYRTRMMQICMIYITRFSMRRLLNVKVYKVDEYFLTSNTKYSTQSEGREKGINGKFVGIVSAMSQRHQDVGQYSIATDMEAPPKTALGYNHLMNFCYSKNDFDQVLKLWRQMKISDCKPNVFVCNTVLKSLGAAGRITSINSFLNQMKSLGITPNISTFNILVKAYSCQSDNFHEAHKIITYMMRNGPSPDVVTFSTLISGLCRAGRILDAYDVFVPRLRKMWKGYCTVNVFTFAPMLQALYRIGRVKEGNHLFGCMLKAGISPNSVSYNILINGLCKNKGFHKVQFLLANSARLGWKPNSVTYNTVLKGLCREGKLVEAFDLVEKMMKTGPCPTMATLNILFHALCNSGQVFEAKSAIDNNFKLGWNASILSYTILMGGYCKAHGLNTTKKLEAVMGVYNDLKDKDIVPNSRTRNLVVQALCKAGKHMVAKSMIDNGVLAADIVTYNILLHAFCSQIRGAYGREDYDSYILDLFDRMKKEKIDKNIFTYTIQIGSLCKSDKCSEAVDLFFESKKKGYSPDLVIYSALISGLINHGSLLEGVKWLNKLLGEDLTPNVPLLNSIVSAFCRKGYCEKEKIYIVCEIIDNCLGRK